jgi:phosphohistidine phosphatase
VELILWRHADAEDPGPSGDAARRLTKRGRKQADRMAEWLGPRLEGDWRIVSSPAKRAVETLKPLDRPFDVRESVGTAADAASVLKEAGWPDADRSVIVVGHQPTLGEVAAHLLRSDEGGVYIRKGAIWWFASRGRGEAGVTVLKAVLDPELLEEPE